MLSPELAASIRRVKGPKKLGVRVGSWLTVQQGNALLSIPVGGSVRGKRDYAMLALLLGCGLRRSELVHLTMEHGQQREEHWAIIDLVGKGGYMRTVPIPTRVKNAIDAWCTAANIKAGNQEPAAIVAAKQQWLSVVAEIKPKGRGLGRSF